MLDDKGSFVGFRGVGSDVTEQRESDEKIAYLARVFNLKLILWIKFFSYQWRIIG